MVIYRLDIYKTNFTIRIMNPIGEQVIRFILNKLTTFSIDRDHKTGYITRNPKDTYFAYDRKLNLYRLPYNCIKDVMLTFGNNNITKDNLEIVYHKEVNATKVNFHWNTNIVLREYQHKYKDAVIKNESPTMMIDLATGYGKTVIASRAVYELGQRLAIIVLPRYIDKWKDDVKKYLNLEDDEFYCIQGSESIEELSNMKPRDIKWKVFILSMTTIRNYLTNYENDELSKGIKLPFELFEHLGVGVLLSDECHQHFHALYSSACYFNVNKFIALSATLDTNDKQLANMYCKLFPPKYRVSNLVEREKYANVRAVAYELRNPKKAKYKGFKGYNHVMYEQYIMRNSKLLSEYINMIDYYLRISYIEDRNVGEKCLIFCATIDMCSIVSSHLAGRYPHLKINKYTAGQPYEIIMTSDVTVSTLGKSGTALDIPGLISCINTISVSSYQSNVQSLGRLRKIEGREVWYTYFYCKGIAPQIKHHNDRRKAIGGTVKTYKFENYPHMLINL